MLFTISDGLIVHSSKDNTYCTSRQVLNLIDSQTREFYNPGFNVCMVTKKVVLISIIVANIGETE